MHVVFTLGEHPATPLPTQSCCCLQNAAVAEQFRSQKAAALHGAAALMTSLSLSHSLCLSLSISFSFFPTGTFMTAPANNTNTPTVYTAPVAMLTSISRSYRHAETYGQSHTYTHVIIMRNGRAAARSVKGQYAQRTH